MISNLRNGEKAKTAEWLWLCFNEFMIEIYKINLFRRKIAFSIGNKSMIGILMKSMKVSSNKRTIQRRLVSIVKVNK